MTSYRKAYIETIAVESNPDHARITIHRDNGISNEYEIKSSKRANRVSDMLDNMRRNYPNLNNARVYITPCYPNGFNLLTVWDL